MNIINYVESNLKPFSDEPFNCVDSLVFSWLSYIHWPNQAMDMAASEGVIIHDFLKAEYFPEMFDGIYEEENTRSLFFAVAVSPRFRELRVKAYVSNFDIEAEMQFSAITIQLDKDEHYISFRGTDSTLIGWKEDFNMAFTCPVPAQREAAKYLKQVGENTQGLLHIGGHSKGGNLAVYSACENTALFDRIRKVYSFDGPGFIEEYTQSEHFSRLQTKISKFVPQSSVIGMLMEEHENYSVIQSDAMGFGQHNAFSWMIDGNDFIRVSELKKNAVVFNKTVNDWLKTLSNEEREQFVETVFSLTEDFDAVKLSEIGENGSHNYPQLMKNLSRMDADARNFVLRIAGNLLAYPFQNIPEYLKLREHSSEEDDA